MTHFTPAGNGTHPSVRGTRNSVLILALLLLSISGAIAQTNTEYSFRHQSTIEGDRYSTDDNVPVLTMDCLAANGYGQWTLSNQSGPAPTTEGAVGNNPTYNAGWFLLANGLYKPSTQYVASSPAHPGCIPPGVVERGDLTVAEPSNNEAKATANLNGAVCFVWPGSDNQSFVVQGYGSSDVDLSMSFSINPLAAGSNPRDIIKTSTDAIHSFSSITTSTGGTLTHTLNGPGSWNDVYDIACDAEYLYIVYCSSQHPSYTGDNQIYAAVIDLNTEAMVTGWPQRIPHTASFPNGTNPTITCDVRNNRTSPTPAFDIVFISTDQTQLEEVSFNGIWGTITSVAASFFHPATGVTENWNACYHARVVRNSIAGNSSSLAIYAIVNPTLLTGSGIGPTLIFYPPSAGGGTASYAAGNLMPPPFGGSGVPVKDNPIVAFADPYDNQSGFRMQDEFHCLFQYDLGVSAAPQEFPLCIVRGADVAASHPTSPDPGNPDTRLALYQPLAAHNTNDLTSYCAAVNQMGIHVHWIADSMGNTVHYYDRDTSRTFDEPIEENTLVTDICTVSDGSSHGGTLGAMLLHNLTMAIWTDPNYGFSISDFSTGLWQPRYYGDETNGVYIDTHVGQLMFQDENVNLTIGEGPTLEPITGTPARLTDVPYFYFSFLGTDRGSTQSVIVNGTWDYYGLIGIHDATTQAITFTASPFTNGYTDWDDDVSSDHSGNSLLPGETGGGNIVIGTTQTMNEDEDEGTDIPGLLNVHGGSNFYCGEWTNFFIQPDANGLSGDVDVLWEGISVPYSVTTCTPAFNVTEQSGQMTLGGKVILQRASTQTVIPSTETGFADAYMAAGGCIRSNTPFAASAYPPPCGDPRGDTARERIILIQQNRDRTERVPDTIQFDAENFTFVDSNQSSTSEIRIGNFDPFATDKDEGDGGDIKFNGCVAQGIELHFIDPTITIGNTPGAVSAVTNYTVENCTFSNLRDEVIFFEDDQFGSNGYYQQPFGNINVIGNTFGAFANDVGNPDDFGEDFTIHGILFINFDAAIGSTNSDFRTFGSINVNSNIFTFTQSSANQEEVDDGDALDGITNGTEAIPNANPSAAIELINTTAFVVDNTISDNGYPVGICLWGHPLAGNPAPQTQSFVCFNTISGLQSPVYDASVGPPPVACSDCSPEIAIASKNTNGFTKLNNISNCDIGYWSEGPDNPQLVLNSIACLPTAEFAIVADGQNANVDLSGWHGMTTGSDDFPAYNSINGPSSALTLGTGPGGIPVVGFQGLLVIQNDYSNTSWFNFSNRFENFGWANWGHNNIDVTSTNSPDNMPLIQSVNGTNTIVSVDSNFWENHVLSEVLNPACSTVPATDWSCSSGETDQFQINYFAVSGRQDMDSNKISNFWTGGVFCGGGTNFIASKHSPNKPQAHPLDSLPTGCQLLYNFAYAAGKSDLWQEEYDSAKELVNECADTFHLVDGAFNFIIQATEGLGNSGTLRANTYAWLKSVLYLNTTDPEYFCQCVYAMSGEIPIPPHVTPDTGYNWELAIINWLLQNTNCDRNSLEQDYIGARSDQYQAWSDASGAYPLDTTLPSLNQIDPSLDTLLQRHFLYSVGTPQGILSNISAYPNPTGSGTVISFGIAQEAYVKIELFDVLGHEVASAGFESLFEPGNKAVPISLASLPSGTYFARIQTTFGETQSVKVVKE